MKKLYTQLRACKNLVFNKQSFIYSTGWIKSIETLSPVNSENQAIPWMNYAFVTFITSRLSKDLKVFEYGSGYSTMYWAKFVKSITAVEYDKSWYDKIREEVQDNVKVIFNNGLSDGTYDSASLQEDSKFDIIFVDGRNRVSCTKHALNTLTSRGLIVLDDSHREKYGKAFQFMKDNGFKEITFTGIKPVSVEFASTTIFYRANNCLGL